MSTINIKRDDIVDLYYIFVSENENPWQPHELMCERSLKWMRDSGDDLTLIHVVVMGFHSHIYELRLLLIVNHVYSISIIFRLNSHIGKSGRCKNILKPFMHACTFLF